MLLMLNRFQRVLTSIKNSAEISNNEQHLQSTVCIEQVLALVFKHQC